MSLPCFLPLRYCKMPNEKGSCWFHIDGVFHGYSTISGVSGHDLYPGCKYLVVMLVYRNHSVVISSDLRWPEWVSGCGRGLVGEGEGLVSCCIASKLAGRLFVVDCQQLLSNKVTSDCNVNVLWFKWWMGVSDETAPAPQMFQPQLRN